MKIETLYRNFRQVGKWESQKPPGCQTDVALWNCFTTGYNESTGPGRLKNQGNEKNTRQLDTEPNAGERGI